MKIQKLISEYQQKILNMDVVINYNTQQIQNLRRQNLSTNEYINLCHPYETDRKIANGKRQSYIQFIVDLESLDL